MNAPRNVLDSFRLDDRVAIITGGSKGLGEAIGRAFAQAGARVVLASRSEEEVSSAARSIQEETGRDALGVAADVQDTGACEQLVSQTLSTFDRLDILVNSAGVNVREPILEMSEADFRRVIDVNLTGTWRMCKAAGPTLVGQRSGRVINLSSILDEVTIPGRTGYSSSKGGVRMLTKTLALEWAGQGVCVNALCPGPFATPMNRPLLENETLREQFAQRIPVGRWGEPWEVGAAAVYLASPAAGFITGATLYIDGGWTSQ